MAVRAHRFRSDFSYSTPGVYLEEVPPKRSSDFSTGIPAILGFSHLRSGEEVEIHALSRWQEFQSQMDRQGADRKMTGAWSPRYLWPAVEGFFQNGGNTCVVVLMHLEDSGEAGLPLLGALRQKVQGAFQALENVKQSRKVLAHLNRYEEGLLECYIEDVDLICFPDLALYTDEVRVALQRDLIDYCARKDTNCFAILDSDASQTMELALSNRRRLVSKDAALYFPWVRVTSGSGEGRLVPPCGHIAGVYSRVDERVGVHKAPANEVLEGVVDLGADVADGEQAELNQAGVNCIRAFRGSGILVWGGRTLGGNEDGGYINVRRTFITFGRWLERRCRDLPFEPSDPALWERIRERVRNFCYSLFQKGALQGSTSQEAFYIKCDEETNPVEVRESGIVVSEIGLAVIRPAEFIVLRITHSTNGTKLQS